MLYIVAAFILSVLVMLVLLSLRKQQQPVDEAVQLMKSGRDFEARELLNDHLKRSPEDYRAYYYLARISEKDGDINKALEYYQIVRDKGGFTGEIDMLEVSKKVAEFHYLQGKMDNAFDSFLYVLKISPSDAEANRHLGFMAIGNEQFKIALPFLEKARDKLTEDRELAIAHAICLYQLGNEKQPFEIFEKLLAKNPDDEDVNLMFVLICRNSHYQEGKKKIKKTLPGVTDDHIKLFLIRMYVYICYREEKPDDALEFLGKVIDGEPQLPEIEIELRYYRLIFSLSKNDFRQAEKSFTSIKESNESYKDLPVISEYIEYMDLGPPIEEIEPFESVYERTFEDIIPENALFNISGLRTNDHIAFDKYYDIDEENNIIELRDEYRAPSMANMVDRYLEIPGSEHDSFARRVINNFGYKVDRKEDAHEKDGHDYFVTHSRDKKMKALFAFRWYSKEAQISDIFISNFINKMKESRVQRGVIIANATLTPGAENAIHSAGNIQYIDKERLGEMVEDYEYFKGR